jgi:hypothetical protein
MQKKFFSSKVLTVLAFFILAISFLPVKTVQASGNFIPLNQFSEALKGSDSSKLVGVYVKDILAFKVVQQSSTYYVSSLTNTVTQFGLAANYGSIGLLAHNYLSGSFFSNLGAGTKIVLVFGDGSTKVYQVESIKKYQALSPNDLDSDFVNLDRPSKTISADRVLNETYSEGDLVLQTCISKDNISTWGRLFIIANLVD